MSDDPNHKAFPQLPDDPLRFPIILTLIDRSLISYKSSNDCSSDWQMFDDP